MRLDEFSNASNIDGMISSTEQTQFLLFGFDLGLTAIEAAATFYECVTINSLINISQTISSPLYIEVTSNSSVGD